VLIVFFDPKIKTGVTNTIPPIFGVDLVPYAGVKKVFRTKVLSFNGLVLLFVTVDIIVSRLPEHAV